MEGAKSKEIVQAVQLLETAYQDTDAAFLKACDQILPTDLGKAFIRTQTEYLRRRENK